MDDEIQITCPHCGWTGDIDECNTPYHETDLWCPECDQQIFGEE